MPGSGHVQKKILLILLGGAALGLSGSPRNYFRILGKIQKEWKLINEQQLQRSIRALYESKLVKEKQNKDGTVTLILSEKGKRKALTYNIDEMQIKTPVRWDGKWRIVLFDIPEKIKGSREILRFYLKNLGFYEFQKSVFVYPFDCQNEMEYIIENFQLRRYVRFIAADFIDNELHLKKYFKLL